MAYQVDFGPWGRIFPVPKALCDRHLKFCSEAQLKVLLLALCDAESAVDEAAIALHLGLSEAEVSDCLQYWAESGLFTEGAAAPAAPAPAPAASAEEPSRREETITAAGQRITTVRSRNHLSPGEINDMLKEDAAFPHLIHELELLYGAPLSPSKREIIAYLYSTMALSADYILLAATFCKNREKKSFRYLEEMLAGWVDDGIDSYEKAEAHIELLTRRESNETRVMRLFGLQQRAATAKEKACIARWCEEYMTPDDLMKYAYDRTVDATGKVSFAYMDKMISEWSRKGITTVEAADAERGAAAKAASGESSFDIDMIYRIMELDSNPHAKKEE